MRYTITLGANLDYDEDVIKDLVEDMINAGEWLPVCCVVRVERSDGTVIYDQVESEGGDQQA